MLRLSSFVAAVSVGCLTALAGCGTTRTSNTARTATEQLLISDAVDRAVQSIDFTVLRGETVYFDEKPLGEAVDKLYLISSFRQHLLASGCVLKDAKDQAAYVVEPRVGAVGTDSYDLLFGIPAVNVPQVSVAPALPAAIPEIPFAQRRDQQGIAKIAAFAYRRESGERVWQSGIAEVRSTANDIWVLGAGPFKRGTIYDGTRFLGKEAEPEEGDETEPPPRVAALTDEAVFATAPKPPPAKQPETAVAGDVKPASAETPVAAAAGPPVLAPPKPISEAPPVDAGG
jgi:hypothetical protein